MPLIETGRPSRMRLARWTGTALAAAALASVEWCLAADDAALPGSSRGEPPLPARNLAVELRQGDSSEFGERGMAAGGTVVVTSDGRGTRIGGAGSLSLRSDAAAGSQDAQQRVMVMNGGRASVRLARSVALQGWEQTWTAGGLQSQPVTRWVEAGQGFWVRPNWPGEGRPVTVEVEAESSTLSEPGTTVGQSATARRMAQAWQQQQVRTEGSRTVTTVQVPLNTWVTVASSDTESARTERSTWSTREVERSGHYVVQIRVSLP